MNARTHETPSHQPSHSSEQQSEPSTKERLDLPVTAKRKLGQATLAASESSSADEEERAYADQLLADVAHWRDWYDEDERDFIHYAANVHPKTPAEKDRYRARLLRAEHDAAFSWQQLQASTREAVSEHAIPSDHYAIAYAQRYGENINPGDTIEAASASLYDERIQALQTALENNSELTDEDRRADIDLLRHTWSVVYAYIEATDDIYHDHSSQLRRNQRHNDMIKHLNKLNDLARQNNVTPLTFRNFMPNDVTFGYQSRLDKANALWNKAEYDRETVASYFRKVFTKEIAREDAARAARARFMR